MKKIKRILAALLLCVMAVALAGCVELDEMKEAHAFWADENHNTVEFNGATYRRLTPHDLLSTWDCSTSIFVTTPDVPVLLVRQFGEVMYISSDQVLMEFYMYDDDLPVIYCREDRFDAVQAQITQGVQLPEVVYNYWDDDGNNRVYQLTAEERAAVETLLSGAGVLVERYTLEEDYSFSLEKSSEDLLFRDFLCDISVDGQEIRILKDNYETEETLMYTVPAELLPTFQKIIKAYASMEHLQYYYEAEPPYEKEPY